MVTKTFLVTGATAFAGCHLVKLLLREGHEVWATSRRTNGSETDVLDIMACEEFEKIHWVFCDLLNRESCRMVFLETAGKGVKFDGIFHLAAMSHPPTSFKIPFYTQDVNVVGTLHLLEAMQDYSPETHFMFCSTSEVYGAPDLKPGEKITEDWPITTVNPYASSKAMIDIFFQERIRNGFLKGFITRAFSHTGPKRGKIFSISSDAYQIARILAGKQEPVILVGNLKSRRVVMDVRDCVAAYYKLMMKQATGVFNVGGDICYEIGYILDHMIVVSGLAEKVTLQRHEPYWRPIDIPIQVPDTTKLKAEVDWKCEIPLVRTLADLMSYWKGIV
jgi:GDP-4-dehydro-6-deoxy-D-mannose reductase